jgi:hypothetical protein
MAVIRKVAKLVAMNLMALIFSAPSGGSGKKKTGKNASTNADASASSTNAQPDATAGAASQDALQYFHNYDLSYKAAIQDYSPAAAETFGFPGKSFAPGLNAEMKRIYLGITSADSFNAIVNKNGKVTKKFCHTEIQAETSLEDMQRFFFTGVQFDTQYAKEGYKIIKAVIITNKIAQNALPFRGKFYDFKPYIFDTSKLNADQYLAAAEKSIQDGTTINEFDFIFGTQGQSKRSPLQLLKDACALVIKSNKDTFWKSGIITKLLLFSNKRVDMSDLIAFRKEILRMGIPIADFIKQEGVDEGVEKTRRQVAVKLIKAGYDDKTVYIASDFSAEEIQKLRAELAVEAPKA